MIQGIINLLFVVNLFIIVYMFYLQTKINKSHHNIHKLQNMAMRVCAELHKEEGEALGLMSKPNGKRGRPKGSKNKGKRTSAQIRYYKRNKVEILAGRREYYKKNRTKMRAKAKKYYEEHK